MPYLANAALAALITAITALPALAACVAPPSDIINRKVGWQDILSVKADKNLNSKINFVQTIQDTGVGEVNLDYYAVTLSAGVDSKPFFETFRKNLPSLLFDKGHSRYVYGLRPYDKENEQTWAQEDPTGAVMSFLLFQVRHVLEFERGSVVVSCADDTSFVFSTVNTAEDGDHPVSGNRGFGVIKNSDSSLTVFTKGADRVKGSSYFNLIGSVERDAIFWAGSKIWEHLLDNLKATYKDLNPRDEVRDSKREAYQPPSNPSFISNNISADSGKASPGLFPLSASDGAAFRNGLRQFDAFRPLYGGSLPSDITGSFLRNIVRQAQTNPSTPTTDIAYLAGLHYASIYNARYATLLDLAHDALKIPNIGIITAPPVGISIAPEIEVAGTSLRRILVEQSAVMALPNGVDDAAKKARVALAAISRVSDGIGPLAASLKAQLEQTAYAAVQAQLDDLRKKAEEAVTEEITKFIAAELDLDPELVKQIMALRTFFSDKQALKQFELHNLEDMNNLLFKALLVTGNCLCIPPKCTLIETLCTAKFFYERIANWNPNWNDAITWGAETLASAYGYEEAAYLAELAKYVKVVQEAAVLYAGFQKTLKGVHAAEDFRDAVVALSAIDWGASAQRTLTTYTGVATGMFSNADVTKLRDLCPLDAADLQRDGCALLNAARQFESESQRAVASLEVMLQELNAIPGLENVLSTMAPVVKQLAQIGSGTIRPTVERLYHELDALALPNGLLNAFDVSTKLISPLARPIIDDVEQAKHAADILAGLNEQAMVEAHTRLNAILGELSLPLSVAVPASVAASLEPEAISSPVRTFSGLTNELSDLYPAQSKDTIIQRYAESQSQFMFFRQFPPYFYKRATLLADTDASFEGIAGNVRKYRAWTTGDPHLQNFGSFLPLNGRTALSLDGVGPKEEPLSFNSCATEVLLNSEPRIVMNDVDDGGEGSPILDVARYLVGLELFKEGFVAPALTRLVSAYMTGISGGAFVPSEVTNRLLAASQGKISDCKLTSGMLTKKSYISRSGQEFVKLRKDARERIELTSTDRQAALALVRQFFSPKAILLDAYKYERLKGGSGGNWRWELLVSYESDLKHSVPRLSYWIEVKGLALLPGNYPASVLRYQGSDTELRRQARNRYRTSLLVTHQGEDALASYRLVETPDGPGLLRYRFSGQDFYSIQGMSPESLLATAQDQMTVLGQIHRKGFAVWGESSQSAIDGYAASLTSETSSLLEFVKQLRGELSLAYKTIARRDELLVERLESIALPSSAQTNELRRLKGLITARDNPSTTSDQEDSEDEPAPPTPTFVIHEVNHDPFEADCKEQTSGWRQDDFQYVSLMNVSDKMATTNGLRFTKGIDFTFPSLEIPPRALVVVARDPEALKSRYVFPPNTVVVGPFAAGTKLAQEGERLKMVWDYTASKSTEVLDFEFKSEWASVKPGHSLMNERFLTETDSLSDEKAWIPYRRETTRVGPEQLVPELLMYRAAAPKAEEHDFVLLANTSKRTINLDGLIVKGGIDAELSGTLESGKRLVLASQAQAFKSRYGTLADRVIEYTGKLSNGDDHFTLSCKSPADAKRIWRVEYLNSDWPTAVNGGGKALRPVNLCAALDLRKASSWEPVSPSEQQPRSPVCSGAELDVCEGHQVSETWTSQFVSGTATFSCQNGDKGPTPVLVEMKCGPGFSKSAVDGSCQRNQ